MAHIETSDKELDMNGGQFYSTNWQPRNGSDSLIVPTAADRRLPVALRPVALTAEAVALAALLAACSPNTSTATPTHSHAPTPTPTSEVLPGYHFVGTPVFELGPLPDSDKQYVDMKLSEYIAVPQKERATGYGAYLAENVYKYSARHESVDLDKGEIISAPLTLNSPTADVLNYLFTIGRLGLSFQSSDKATPTVLNQNEADKLYASFYAVSPDSDNAAYDGDVAYAKTSKFIDVDTSADYRIYPGSAVIINEGTRTTITDADGNKVVEIKGVQYHSDKNTVNFVANLLLYEGTDPVTKAPAVYPVFELVSRT